MEYCTKTIINCLDDWELFTKETEKILGECSLSSSGTITAYEKVYYDTGTSGQNTKEHYYFG